jgi:hypothetical protein
MEHNIEYTEKRAQSGKASNRGQALVEMALILPILLLLFAGLIELGFSFYDYLIVVNAAREGARFGAKMPDYTVEEIVEVTNKATQPVLTDFTLKDEWGEDVLDAEGRLITNPERASVIVSRLTAPVPVGNDDYTYYIDEGYPSAVGKAALAPADQVIPIHSSRVTQGRVDSIAQEVEAALQGATFEEDAQFVIVEVVYDHPQVIRLFKIGEIIPDPIPLSSLTLMRVITSVRQPACAVCPIALNWDIIDGLVAGTESDTSLENIWNGTGSGQFGWLTWPGDDSSAGSAQYLAEALRNCNLSKWDYVNPDDFDDEILNVGDQIAGNTGVSDASYVEAILESYMASEEKIPVAVWEDFIPAGGSDIRYVLKGYAWVIITDYDLSGQGWISAVFDSYSEDCDKD